MEKRKIYGTIIGVIAFLILVIGATYAFFGWKSTDNINVNLTINGKGLESVINYNQGTSILDTTGEALVPVDSYNEGINTTIEFWKDPSYTKPIYGEISMEVLNLLSKTDSTDTNIAKTNTIKWAITTYNVNDSTEVLLNEGTFNGKEIGDKWAISSDFELNGYQTFYKIYLWLDIMAIDKNLSIEGELLSTEISARASDTAGTYYIPPNKPALTDNLIPVYFDEEIGVWKTTNYTNENNKWYNYEEKKWANAVLLTESKRNEVLEPGTQNVIPEIEISDTEAGGTLAFYVWIPRYKYKVWNINKTIGTDSYDAYNTGIDIVFESATSTSGTIKCNYDFTKIATETVRNEECTGSNGEYYTHPAFTFGNDELTGFWMGKFQVSSVGATIENNGGGLDADANLKITGISPLILPNALTWRQSMPGVFWYNIHEINSNNDNIYGLNSNKNIVDSHMITNLEWGAITYLSHSKYGTCFNNICSNVGLNNSCGNVSVSSVSRVVSYAGRSFGGTYTANSDYTNYGTYSYDGKIVNSSDGTSGTYNKLNLSLGGKASTTGNIYGVYDMAGGAYSLPMANMSGTDGIFVYTPLSDTSNLFIYDGNEKYLTTYAHGMTGNDQISLNRTRLGDGIGELVINKSVSSTEPLKSWYNNFVSITYRRNETAIGPWITRGSSVLSDYPSGIFTVAASVGSGGNNASTHAILAVLTD